MEFQVPTSKLLITGLYPAFITPFKCLNQPRQWAGEQGFVFRQRKQICILFNTSRQALGPNETPSNGHRGSFKRLKRPGIGVYHAYPSSVEVKKWWSHNTTPLICLHGVEQAPFFTLLKLRQLRTVIF